MSTLKSRRKFDYLFTTFVYFYVIFGTAQLVLSVKQKRQLFREQILPHKGGKIPESAFEPERLFLNRLDQQGTSLPDGIIPNQRVQLRHPFPKLSIPETLKVPLRNDGRYVAPPGLSYYEKQPTVDTTYTIRPIHKLFDNSPILFLKQTPVLSIFWNTPDSSVSYKTIKIEDLSAPVLINDIPKVIWKNKLTQDYIDPSEPLKEYSHYLEKIHDEYD